MTLKTYIVDDEAPARARIRKLLRPLVERHEIEIVGEAKDGHEAVSYLGENNVDLLLLDVKMPELDGFAVLERIPPQNRPAVVFTTAFDEYAVRAFTENAVDYLQKPIAQERLEEAVSRVRQRRQAPDDAQRGDEKLGKLLDWLDAQEQEPTIGKPATGYLKQISIPYRDRILIVPIHRLISAEISEGITRLHVLDEDEATPKKRLRQHIVSYTLEQLEASLDPDHFMRVHRSAIVQIDHIVEMISWFSGRYKLVLTGGHEVIASRERSKHLKERLVF